MDITGFLGLLQGVHPSGDGWTARCPAHDDKRASLSIKSGPDGKILWHCHAKCDWKSIPDALRIPMSDLFGDAGRRTRKRQDDLPTGHEQRVVAATYDYEAIDGTLLYQAVRLEPKAFYQRVPHPTAIAEWLNGLSAGWYRKQGAAWRRVSEDRNAKLADAVWTDGVPQRVLYRLPGLDAIRPSRLYVVEGEKDADALWTLGTHATTSVAGAGKWRPWGREYAAQVQAIGATDIVLIPDNDDVGRKHMADVGESLAALGIACRWLELPGLPDKGDTSDWLKAGGTLDQLHTLADGGTIPPKASAPTGPAEPAPGVPAVPDGIGYGLDEYGRLCVVRGSAGGNQSLEPLATFDAWITEEIQRDDGIETAIEYMIRGRTEGGDALRAVTIPADRYRAMSWLDKSWGSIVTVYPGQSKIDHLQVAIKLRSNPIRRKTFAHTGWREISGRWCYLHAAGAIGDPEAIVDLGHSFDRFRLPDYDPIKAQAGTRLSWRLYGKLAPARVMAPLWAAVWRAPLCSALATPFALVLLGSTGIMKSSLAAVAFCHYGDFPDKTAFPEAWLSSAGAMEDLAFRLKDMLCPLDDYVRQAGDRDIESKGTRMIRAQGNLTSRGRLNADLSRRESRPPRGLILMTAEGMPPGESVAARTFAVELRAGDVAVEAMDQAQRPDSIRLLGHAMAGYVTWLSTRVGDPAFVSRVRERFRTLRAAVRDSAGGVHMRVPETAAHLLLGAEVGLEYAVGIDALDEAEGARLAVEAREAIASLIAAQGREIGSQKPTTMFLDLLQSCLLARRVCFARSLDGMADQKPPPVAIGWANDRAMYLLPGDGVNSVYRAIRDSGEQFAILPRRLMTELVELGVVEPDPKGGPAKVVKSSGRSVRAYVILREQAERVLGHEIVVPGVDAGYGSAGEVDQDDGRAPF